MRGGCAAVAAQHSNGGDGVVPHFRVDDNLEGHPKAQRAGDEALGMWLRAGSWCMRYLTDGFVPDWWVKQQPKGVAKARRLVDAGFWHPAEQDGEKGWQFHEFIGPGRQDSREKIEADRELARKRKQKSRGSSQEESREESQRDTPRDERRESRRSPGYTQPNPTHEEISGYVPIEATDPNAHGISATPGADLVREIVPKGHPPATLTALRLQASELLNSGTERDDVAAGLRLWCDKPGVGNGRTILASLVSEAIKSRTTAGRGARTAPSGMAPGEAKVLGWASLGNPDPDQRKAIGQ
jgi:hypothetical protein